MWKSLQVHHLYILNHHHHHNRKCDERVHCAMLYSLRYQPEQIEKKAISMENDALKQR